jgi:predicted transposase/invertase (TIGR01784 family)
MKKQESKFARATFDSSFKYLMLDEEVRLSFLRTFTGRDDIIEVSNYSTSVPSLRPGEMDAKKTQRHMDFACRMKNGAIFIAEVQIRREDYWDARSLYYAAGVYSQQLMEGDPWSLLQNVIGINILDHDTGTLTKHGDFEKHYVMMDKLHPHNKEWPYIQIRQFEIPRINFDLIEDGPKKQWLKIFKESVTMNNIPNDFDPIIQKALGYLERARWGGKLIAEYESEELNLTKYTTVLKEERDEGIKEGIKEGMKAVAISMLKEGESLEKISLFTGLSQSDIQKLKIF